MAAAPDGEFMYASGKRVDHNLFAFAASKALFLEDNDTEGEEYEEEEEDEEDEEENSGSTTKRCRVGSPDPTSMVTSSSKTPAPRTQQKPMRKSAPVVSDPAKIPLPTRGTVVVELSSVAKVSPFFSAFLAVCLQFSGQTTYKGPNTGSNNSATYLRSAHPRNHPGQEGSHAPCGVSHSIVL